MPRKHQTIGITTNVMVIPAAGTLGEFSTSAWVAAVISNGGTVSTGRQTLVNSLITGLKSDGVWTKLDRLWMLAAENQPSALTDMVALTLATAFFPSFTIDRGYTGEDAANPNTVINSEYAPSTQGVQYTQDAAHQSGWIVGNVAPALGGAMMGFAEAPFDNQFFVTFTDGNVYGRINDNPGSGSQGAPGTRQGHWLMNRSGASATQLYQNAMLFSSPNATSGALSNQVAYLLSGIISGTPSSGNPNQFAMFSFGGNLSATDVSNFYARLRTYMTAVGVP